MNDLESNPNRYGPEEPSWLDTLSQGPFRLRESTTDEELALILTERLTAVMDRHSISATPEGWRELMLYSLVQKGAPLEFVTDGDLVQGGPDGAAMQTFILRTKAKQLRRSGKAKDNVEAATILSKAKGEKRTVGTIKKLLSAKSAAAQTSSPLWSRAERRLPSEFRVLRILGEVATKLEDVTN